MSPLKDIPTFYKVEFLTDREPSRDSLMLVENEPSVTLQLEFMLPQCIAYITGFPCSML